MGEASPLLRTTLSLLLLQVFSRLFSFGLNQVLLRSTTAAALGLITMGFEVVRDTSLFVIREGIRSAIIRKRNYTASNISQRINQTLLIPTILSPIIIPIFLLYANFPPNPMPAHFYTTLSLYILSTIIELLAEPYYLKSLQNWELSTPFRVRVEGIAIVTKAIGTLIAVKYYGQEFALVAFGIGQLAYSIILIFGFWFISKEGIQWRVQKVEGKRFDEEIIGLGMEMTKQSLVKQFLTESDKIIVGRFSKVEDQGGYAIALNYGSLVARILFQPLEETSRLFYSRQLSTPSLTSLQLSSSLLASLILLQTHLALIFSLLVPSFTSPLIYHLLGSKWSYPASRAPLILGVYVGYYLPIMGINGITEAFFQAVAGSNWLKSGSWWWIFCSIMFILIVAIGKFGEEGLILVNCFCMLLRIGFSTWFIRDYFKAQLRALVIGDKEEDIGKEIERTLEWSRILPKFFTLVVFGISSALVRWSENRSDWKSYRGLGEHVAVGAGVGILCLLTMYLSEQKKIRKLLASLKSKSD